MHFIIQTACKVAKDMYIMLEDNVGHTAVAGMKNSLDARARGRQLAFLCCWTIGSNFRSS